MKKRKSLLRMARKQYRDSSDVKPEREITDPEVLKEYQIKLAKYRDDIRKEKISALREAKKEKRAKHNSDNPRVEWYFKAGMLVSIKESAFKKNKWDMERMNLYSGAIGVVVSTEDSYDTYKQEKNRLLDVLSPNGEMQRWPAKWINVVED